jgi:hypothetical protein
MGASGASGGILIKWDRRVVEKVDECVGRYTLAVSLRNADDNFMWAFGGVYGPNDAGEMRVLWDEMAGLISWWDRLWCFGGDFNVVGFRVSDRKQVVFLLQWKIFQSSYMGRVWWIFLSKKGSSLGPITRYGLKLIGFCYLWSRKNITLMCHNDDCLEFYRTISLCCWIVEHKEKGKGILNLKTCSSNPMVLWNKCNVGGRLITFKVC